MSRFWRSLKALVVYEVRLVREMIRDPQRNRFR